MCFRSVRYLLSRHNQPTMATHQILVFLTFFAVAMVKGIHAQLSEEELPPDLRYLLNSGLDKWEPPQEMSKKLPFYLSGFDSENRPFWIVEFGKWDLRSFFEKGEKWDKLFDKYVDKFLWTLWDSLTIKATEENPVKDLIILFDMEGYDLQQMNSPGAVSYIVRKMRTVTQAVPLTYGTYVINANFLAKNLIALLRPILGREFDRVEVFGTNPSRYRPFLLRNIPKDQIPEWYGGAKNFKPLRVYG